MQYSLNAFSVLEDVIVDIGRDFCQGGNVSTVPFEKQMRQQDPFGRWYLDSLCTYQLASYVAQMFDLPKHDEQCPLFEEVSLSAWSRVTCNHIQQNHPDVSFYTSGTTGKRKLFTHKLSKLYDESWSWITLFDKPEKVFINVPRHHIYGFIWGAIIPIISDAAVIDYRKRLINREEFVSNSWVVTTPHTANTLFSLTSEQASNVTVILSTAPCDHSLLVDLYSHGFKRVIHVYGSTETGGVGWRDQQCEEFSLVPGMFFDNEIVRNADGIVSIQDHVQVTDGNKFNVLGRVDKQCQINGYNVDINQLSKGIKNLSGVGHCDVKLLKDIGSSPSLSLCVGLDGKTGEEEALSQILAMYGKVVTPSNVIFTST